MREGSKSTLDNSFGVTYFKTMIWGLGPNKETMKALFCNWLKTFLEFVLYVNRSESIDQKHFIIPQRINFLIQHQNKLITNAANLRWVQFDENFKLANMRVLNL